MATTENLSTLKIYKLTQAQYDAELANNNINENAIYLTPDDGVPTVSGGAYVFTGQYVYDSYTEDYGEIYNVTLDSNYSWDALVEAVEGNRPVIARLRDEVDEYGTDLAFVSNDFIDSEARFSCARGNEILTMRTAEGSFAATLYIRTMVPYASLKSYATKAQLNAKADSDHNHNDVYYTETEVDNALALINASIDDKATKATTLSGYGITDAYTKTEVDNKAAGLASTSAVDTKISTHNTTTDSHNDIRDLITGLTTRLNTLANSDDTTLDQMSEVVAYIKNNKNLIDGITTSKVNVSDIINNLTTNVTNKPLSAAQGVALKGLIDTLQSELDTHEANKSNPHGVTAAQVGLGNVNNTSDANKPVSTAQATAIADAKKAGTDAQTNLGTHTSNKSNPHGVTAEQISALPLAGGVMTGAIDVSGTQNVLDFGTTGYFRGTTASGNKFDFMGLVGSTKFVVGGTYPELELKGKNERPTYNGNDMALESDLDAHTSNTTVHITSGERTNWNAAKTHADSVHAPSNAQANVIESIKVNGTAQTISSKSVNITVPTKVSELTNDSGFKTTDTTYGVVSTTADGLAPKRDGSTTKFLRADGTWASIDSIAITAEDIDEICGASITMITEDGEVEF